MVTEKTLSDRFAIIYPNGGSEASPANITINQRYVMDNPFPGRYVACVPEVLFNGHWGVAGWESKSDGTYYGVAAGQFNDDIIFVQTAYNYVLGAGSRSGNGFGDVSSLSTTLPCRVKVWRVD